MLTLNKLEPEKQLIDHQKVGNKFSVDLQID